MVLASGAITPPFAQNVIDPSPTAAPAPRAESASGSSPAALAAPGNPATNPPPAIRSLSPWFYEVEQLARASVEDSVIQTYITSSAGTFNLTARTLHLPDFS
jgi:hypothetical protein